MGALRVVFSVVTLNSTSPPMPIMLDGWRAELYLSTSTGFTGPPDVLLDGVPMQPQLFPLTGPGGIVPVRLKFGGMTLGGKPVNMNKRLLVNMPPGVAPGNTFVVYMTQTYFDPTLKDPQA